MQRKRSAIVILLAVGGLTAVWFIVFSLRTESPPNRAATLIPVADRSPIATAAQSSLASENTQVHLKPIGDAVARFEEWAVHVVTIGISTLSSNDLATGETLALQRRQQLRGLIRTNPRRALDAAVPFAWRTRLPESIVRHLEERVSGRGSLSVMLATDFERNASEVRREVIFRGRRYDAFVYGMRRFQPSRKSIPLHGVAVDDLLAVAESPVRALEAGESPPPGSESKLCPVSARRADADGTPVYADVGGRVESFCGARHLVLLAAQLAGNQGGSAGGQSDPAVEGWSQGPKTCLFMRVAFPDDPTEPISEEAAQALMDNVKQWYVESSYDTTSITSTVTPLLMLPHSKDYYTVQSNMRLLEDARSVARDAGYDTDQYDWDIVRHSQVPGFNFAGAALIGEKGVWLQDSSAGVACHELGHNYGLWHANSWNSINDSVIGIGTHSEYGNIFDTMGVPEAGNYHFNAAFKHQLNWLPASFVENVTASGTYRVYTFDIPTLTPTRKYALRVKKNYGRNYWAEYRQKFNNRWFFSGIILNWDPWSNGVHDSVGGTHLLDTTPGTPDHEKDCAVVLGRTFSDFAAGVHLTPIAKGNLSPENWIEIVVNIGEFPENHPPIASITADRVAAEVNQVIHFIALASDPDGNPLAYHWDFGDATFGANEVSATKSWPAAGEYAVRCIVSDMMGGICSRLIVVTIGSPATFRLSGRVLTEGGVPVEGVRVHNGNSSIFYRGTYTDSDGRYTLANLRAGSVRLSTVKYGYTLRSTGWINPVRVGPNATDLDFAAVPDPAISLAATLATATETGLVPGRVTITRRGQTNVALVVKLNRTGNALPDSDYTTTPTLAGDPPQVILPAGESSLGIEVMPVVDSLSEGPETVTFTLIEDASYILGGLAEATVTLLDRPFDAWRFTRFTAAELADPMLTGLVGDPDRDRLSNLLEYGFGLEPKIADTESGFHGRIEALPDGSAYVVTFHRRKEPTDISYEVEVSNDLVNWNSGSDQTLEIRPARDDGNGITETAEVRLVGSLVANGVRFVRLKVSLRDVP